MARNSVLIYRDFFETMKGVSERSYKRIMNAVMAYALDGIEPNLSGLENVVFAQAKIWIDNNNRRYENGKQGGRPRNQEETKEEPNGNQNITEIKPNGNQEKTKEEPNGNQNITEIKPNGNQEETKEEPNHNLNVKCKVLSDKCDLKERKKVSNIYLKNNTQGARETYDEIMDDWGCSPPVKAALGRFIQHCTLNGQKLTNDRLNGIIEELDFKQGLSDDEQIKALDTAIAKGYFDIKRGG